MPSRDCASLHWLPVLSQRWSWPVWEGKNYSGAVVIVSHDKMFLDNVTNRTIEISLGRIYDYNKPYTKFLELRKEIKVQQLAAQKKLRVTFYILQAFLKNIY